MDVKACAKCDLSKPAGEFYANDRTCKACRRAMVRANRAARIEHYEAYERDRAMLPDRVDRRSRYQKSPAGKSAIRRSRMRFIERNPHKRAAHIAVGNAIRDGRLHRQPCEVCGETRVHAHHDDYSTPLAVRWLCAKHHAEHHFIEGLRLKAPLIYERNA